MSGMPFLAWCLTVVAPATTGCALSRLRAAISLSPPPCLLVPSQAFLDVWEKNVPMSGFSALPPQPGHL